MPQQTKNCTTSFVAHSALTSELQLECSTTIKELHNRYQETPKSMYSSGTSGPIASRDDGAIFLTAVKTNEGSVHRGSSLRWEVPPQNARHDLIPTPGSDGWTDGKSVCRKRFLDTDSSRDKHDSSARTWSHRTDAATRPRPRTHARPLSSECFVLVLNLFTFRISGFQFPPGQQV